MQVTKSSWLVWCVAASFFAFQFVLRLFPGLMMHDIMTHYGVGALDFGILSAAYYVGYSGCQIPIGLLLDRYQPKYVISFCAFICGLGLLPFVYSSHWTLAILGRFLVGAGSAAGFLGVAKIVRSFFPASHFTLMIGVSFSYGLLGALYGGKPTHALMEQLGWKGLLEILSWISFGISAFILFSFPKNSKEHVTNVTQTMNLAQSPEKPSFLHAFRELLTYPQLFWIALGGALMVGPLEGFADLWGVSFLVQVHHLPVSEASFIISCIYFGMLIGGPILSFCAQRYDAYARLVGIAGLCMAIAFAVLLFTPKSFSNVILSMIMGWIGIFCCYQVIVFGLVSQIVPPHLNSLALSATNCINMLAGSLFHLSMGWIMDVYWSGEIAHGIKAYSIDSYINAISLLPASLLLGCGLFFMLKRPSVVSQNMNEETPVVAETFL